jgi:benzil reductase ((S)-benzoin forming)
MAQHATVLTLVVPSSPTTMTMTMRHLYILTGTTRGLGLALAQALLHPEHALLCIARAPSAALHAAAKAHGCDLTDWTVDLAQCPTPATPLREWLERHRDQASSVSLIHNAGVIPRIAPLAGVDGHDIARALRVNLEAPLQLSAEFLASTAAWIVPRKLLFISSGLGRRPMAAQTVYCASKAGLDHAARCIALEQAHEENGARVCSLAPGVIDTGMQAQLRGASAQDFPDRPRFEQLQGLGQLDSPAAAARKVLAHLARPDFGGEPVADVRG